MTAVQKDPWAQKIVFMYDFVSLTLEINRLKNSPSVEWVDLAKGLVTLTAWLELHIISDSLAVFAVIAALRCAWAESQKRT